MSEKTNTRERVRKYRRAEHLFNSYRFGDSDVAAFESEFGPTVSQLPEPSKKATVEYQRFLPAAKLAQFAVESFLNLFDIRHAATAFFNGRSSQVRRDSKSVMHVKLSNRQLGDDYSRPTKAEGARFVYTHAVIVSAQAIVYAEQGRKAARQTDNVLAVADLLLDELPIEKIVADAIAAGELRKIDAYLFDVETE